MTPFFAACLMVLGFCMIAMLSLAPRTTPQRRLASSLHREDRALRRSLSVPEYHRRHHLPFDHRRSLLERDIGLLVSTDVADEPEMRAILTRCCNHFDRADVAHRMGLHAVATTQHDLCFAARGEAIVAHYPIILRRRASAC